MPQEIEAILHYNGFRVVERYSDYDGTLPTASLPARVYICEKRQLDNLLANLTETATMKS